MDRRAELQGYIAQTRRLQHKMRGVFLALGAIALSLLAWRTDVGVFASITVGLVAICSFWVTAAHNAAHRQKLDELARIERNDGRPLQTAHRRWMS